MTKTWTWLQHRQRRDSRSTQTSKCRMMVSSSDDKPCDLPSYSQLAMAGVSIPGLQLMPLLHNELLSLIFMLTRSTLLPATMTLIDFVKIVGAASTKAKILHDFWAPLLPLIWGLVSVLVSCGRATVLCWKCSFCCYSATYATASFATNVPCFCKCIFHGCHLPV